MWSLDWDGESVTALVVGRDSYDEGIHVNGGNMENMDCTCPLFGGVVRNGTGKLSTCAVELT